MNITQIVGVELSKKAKDVLSFNTVCRIEDWLSQWTCIANFKAVITHTAGEGMEACRETLRKELVPAWAVPLGVKPEHFTFQVSAHETDNNGRFWLNNLGVVVDRIRYTVET